MKTTDKGWLVGAAYTLNDEQREWLTDNGISWEHDCLGGYTFRASVKGASGLPLRLVVCQSGRARQWADGTITHYWYSYMGPARSTHTSLKAALKDMLRELAIGDSPARAA